MADDRPAEALEEFHAAIVALIDALDALCEARDQLRPRDWRERAPPKDLISAVTAAADRASAAAAPIESDLEQVATLFPDQKVGGCLGLGWHMTLLAWARRRVVGASRSPAGRAKLRDRVDEAFWTPNFEFLRLALKREYRRLVESFREIAEQHRASSMPPARDDAAVEAVVLYPAGAGRLKRRGQIRPLRSVDRVRLLKFFATEDSFVAGRILDKKFDLCAYKIVQRMREKEWLRGLIVGERNVGFRRAHDVRIEVVKEGEDGG